VASPLLECVPNVSEGHDLRAVEAVADAVRGVPGVTLADVHADPDHHRSVFTFLGAPQAVEEAALALAAAVFARVDMREHRGIHPRLGALDVMPFVPLRDLAMADAVTIARRVGQAMAALHTLPVYFYGAAATRVERYRFRGGRISTPWNEATLDPSGARFRRTSHDDPMFLDRLDEALA